MPVVELRELLERLEEAGGPVDAAVAYVAVSSLELDEDELRGARRRALLLLASGGDPRRDLEPDSRAVAAFADELDTPARRQELAAAVERLRAEAGGLAGVSAAADRLLGDDVRAWRSAACALLAAELADDRDE